MKHFIGADIEAPHLSFYATIDDAHDFYGRWAWADKNGLPPKGEGVIYFDDIQDAQNAANDLRKSGGGIGQHSDTIQVVSLELEDT